MLVAALACATTAGAASGSDLAEALQRVRSDPARASDGAAIDELVRIADHAPAEALRVEAWALAAEAYGERLDRPADSARLWERILGDAHADPVTAAYAARSLVRRHLARGDVARAEAVVTLAGPRADATLARDVERAGRRRLLHHAAASTLALAVVLATGALVRAARARRLRYVLGRARAQVGLVAGYAAYVAIAGAALASGYEHGTARPFLVLGAVLVPILLLARAWAAAGGPSRAARAGRAALCAIGTIAAAFLVLETIDVAYLEGLGL